jgi:hypothetical protein
VIADVVYRLLVISGTDGIPPAANLDLLAFPAVVSTVWLVQLFRISAWMRRLRKRPGEPLGMPPEGLLALLLALVAGGSWFAFGRGIYRLAAGQPVDVGGLAASLLGIFIAALLWSLLFLIPSVRKGGIWIGGSSEEKSERRG